jgi:hypothetical protein
VALVRENMISVMRVGPYGRYARATGR